ncbi:MAG: arsenate reductase ArsC [Methanomassiliicoccales archaeon]|jgi:arsenate reductase
MKRVLFICTHNSARSQMAEGLVNEYHSKRWVAHSAGTKPTSVHPLAKKAMAELGIDISSHHSKALKDFKGDTFDLVVTVCDDASETCPFFPAERIIHRGFPDPALVTGSEEERLEAFRRTRDEIKDWIASEL